MLFVFFFLGFSGVSSSDVLLQSSVGQGQGLLFENNGVCYAITPKHVVDSAQDIQGLMADRKSFNYTTVKTFDVDLAVLEPKEKINLCLGQTFSSVNKLTPLLAIVDDAVLKTKLGDGSTLQTKVKIVAVDNTEYLQIKAVDESDQLKQGYSGGALYIADQLAGILLEVSDGSGFVYRSDALARKVNSYFYPRGNVNKPSRNTWLNGELSGFLSKGKTLEYDFVVEKNSPIEFLMPKQSSRVDFRFELFSSRGNSLGRHDFRNSRENWVIYTPTEKDTLKLKLTGTDYQGPALVRIMEYTKNSDLMNPSNVLSFGSKQSLRLAQGARSEYKFKGQKNSPLEFRMPKAAKRVDYSVRIENSRGVVLFEQGGYRSDRDNSLSYTPLKDDTYKLVLIGTGYYGNIIINMSQYALDSSLRGAGNVLKVGDEADGYLAYEAEARYKFDGQKNSPVEFEFPAVDDRVGMSVQIKDGRGMSVFSVNHVTHEHYRVAFTPKQTGQYILHLVGNYDGATDNRRQGKYHVKMYQYTLDSALRGAGNVLTVGDEADGLLAYEAEARYKFDGQKNSPVEFEFPAVDDRVGMSVQIKDGRGMSVFSVNHVTHEHYRVAFTPKQTGQYILHLVGNYDGATDNRRQGKYHVKMYQYTLDSALRGAGNVLTVGDEADGLLAYEAVAEYKYTGQSGVPIDIELFSTDDGVYFYFQIYDSMGLKIFEKGRLDSSKRNRYTFTPPKNDDYVIRLIGTENSTSGRRQGKFHFKLWGKK